MMRRTPAIVLASVFAFTAVACTKPAPGEKGGDAPAAEKDGTPLAHVGNTVITVEEFKDAVNKQAPFIRSRMDSPEKKKEFLDNMVRFELLAQEAERQGLDKDPVVVENMRKLMVQQLMRKRMESDQVPAPTDQQLKDFYQAHIDDYVKPERVRVSQVFVAAPSGDKAARAAARKKAASLLSQIKARKKEPLAFSQLAQANTDDAASRARGGDLGYLSEADLTQAWGAKAAEAAFGLTKVGDLSGVVEGDKGFHVFKLTGRQKALERTFDQVRRNVEQRVKQELRRKAYVDFVDGLRDKSGVTVEQATLEGIDLGSSGARRPAMGMPMGHPTARPAAMPAGHGAPAPQKATDAKKE